MIDLTTYSVPELRLLMSSITTEILNRNKSEFQCSICKQPAYSTPSGMVCENGHGGADESSDKSGLTEDQQDAWVKITKWLKGNHPVFVLRGFAGTGKSFLMKKLRSLPDNFIFAAPTNKASQILAEFLGVQVKTIYSVLGLKMAAEEDKLVLTQAIATPDLGSNPVLVIDEAGMINTQIADILKQGCADHGWRILFVGDPAQLNPIGEDRSPVWKLAHPDHKALLTEVKRYDNELLALATSLRECVKSLEKPKVVNNNSNEQGVYVVTEQQFENDLRNFKLKDWETTKVVAWRNRTCDFYNDLIRTSLGFRDPYCVGEHVLLAAPLISDKTILGYTDEELVITSISSRMFTFPEGNVEAYAMSVKDRSFNIYVPVKPDSLKRVLNRKAELANSLKGKGRKEAWASFWAVQSTFQSIRYGYAMTAHRLQGSTCSVVYVDKRDIQANPNTREAYRCLYVAATRPTTKLVTF